MLSANDRQYCGKKYHTTELSLDHVIPRSQGDRTPEQAHLRLVAVIVGRHRGGSSLALQDSCYS